MKASIHTAKDSCLETKKSKGKELSISRGPIAKIKAVNRRGVVVSLEITATRSRNPGTGERYGAFKAYGDSLKLELEPKDLSEILTAAIANGLISVVFKAKRND